MESYISQATFIEGVSNMGILNKIKGWLLKSNENYTVEFDINSIENKGEYVSQLREQINELEGLGNRLTKEYEKLTNTIVDLQKIERIPKAHRKEILETASMLKNSEDERKRYQEKVSAKSEAQYKYIEQNQDSIKEDIKKIKELEDRQLLLKTDLNHLEGEKGDLEYTKQCTIDSSIKVRRFSIISVGVIAIMLVILIVMISDGLDIVVPSILLVFYGALVVFIVFTNRRKSEVVLKTIGLKQVRVVQIQDKVKIKYVNTTSYLEYEYAKYHVMSYNDLMYQYQQYSNRKIETRNYRNATDNILRLEEKLQEQLKKVGIGQGIIFRSNIDALVTSKALEELIDEYTSNREKLKEQLAFNQESLEMARYKLNAIDKASNI
jgi:hypothetical protein